MVTSGGKMTTDLILGGLTVRSDSAGRLHFWGDVYNLGLIDQRWVRLTIRLLDAKDQPLAEQTDMLGLEWTLSGKRNPFQIIFEEPPEKWAGYDMRLSGRIHEADDASSPQPYLDLATEHVTLDAIGRGGLVCELRGQVVNTGKMPTENVKVAAALYGARGTVVAALSPYLKSGQVLEPGETAAFGLKFYTVGEEPLRYKVQVQGRQVKIS